jgi:hypothetical protein
VLIPVADPQGVLEDPLHAGRNVAFLMIPDQRATPAKQMGQTRLMDRVLEPPIGRPTVAHEDAREVGALVMPRFSRKYKRMLLCSRRSDGDAPVTTR